MSVQSPPAIRLRNVSKRFAFTPDTPQSVQETLISAVSRRRAPKGDLWAVRDVTFEVQPGQCVGIIGRNGSGKSTLLKLIARILQPTGGEIIVRGRTSALLELGAGFHADLTGRENIYLNASVLGLNQAETDELFDDIVEFSELGDFIDMQVKHYSSGMYMRLGFSVAIHVRPDILVVDEILAVGDQTFQTKCMERITELQSQGVTILIVSHDLGTMAELCTDLVWMDKGEVRLIGPTEFVLEQYNNHLFQRVGARLTQVNRSGSFTRWGTQQISIAGVRLLDANGEESTMFSNGDRMTIEIAYRASEPVVEPEFGLAIYRHDGVHVNGPNTRLAGLEFGELRGSGVIRYEIDQLPLLPARYQLSVAIHDSKRPLAYDFHEKAYAFRVREGSGDSESGLVSLDAAWSWEPGQEAAESEDDGVAAQPA